MAGLIFSPAQVQAAAQEVVAVQLAYARRGVSLAQAALAGAKTCVELRHHPAADAVDVATGTEFYYHAHASRRRPEAEHGHFHLFKRVGGPDPHFFHVAALSLDPRGLPLRWFVTNRWVTGERWTPAVDVITSLPGLHPRAVGRLAPVARWLGAMLVLHAEPLAALLRLRDRRMATRLQRADAAIVFEDRRLDVVAESAIDLPARLGALTHPANRRIAKT